MKRYSKIITALLTIAMLTVVFTACGKETEVITNNFGETYYTNVDTIITYKVDGQSINAQVNENKSLVFQGIFNTITELEEKPDCTFSKDFMVTIDGKEYLVAQDGCNNAKIDGKYYRITESDRAILNSIFKENGAIIPEKEAE